MKRSYLHRLLACLLCIAMLLPNFTVLVNAVGSDQAQPSRSVSTWTPVSNPFESGEIPAYLTAQGTVSSEALEYDCGNGLSGDGAKSYMVLVENTTFSELDMYINALNQAGFTRTFQRTLSADESGLNNSFYRFLSPQKNYVLSVYFLETYHEVRIIADTAEDIVKEFSAGFVYKNETNEVTQPMITMYGLSMSPNGYDITTKSAYSTGARNCGALVVVRMPDNSLFINDGGDIQQWSNEACADFMEFCRQLTGKQPGEKVIINTWFISHGHSDHFDGIPRFFDLYHDEIDIKNVMYNIDSERLGTTRDMSAVLQMVSGYFPNVKYYKPHTGDTFNIAGVQFDVLYAQEDRFVHNSANKMVIDIRDGDETNPNENRDGTYREFLYEEGDIENFSDFNDTSTVLKLTFPKGITDGADVSCILYGDVNLADQILLDIWPDAALETDIMMVPHHGHDAHPELVALSNAKIFLYTQAKSAIYGPNGIVDKNVDQKGTYRDALVNNFLAMHDSNGQKYFDTTSTRKTYWEGTETACILFGEDVEFVDMPEGLTRDESDPKGFTVYTKDAPFFEYEGWVSVSTARPTGETSTATGVAIDTTRIRFDLVTYDGGLTNNSRYLIVHDKTDSVLMYNPVATYVGQTTSNLGTSMKVGTGAQASAGITQAYYKVSNGEDTVAVKDSIYFARHLRNDSLWITSQTDLTGNGTAFSEYKTNYFGGKHYRYVSMVKGLTTDDAYWTSVSGNDYTGKDAAGNPIGDQWRNLRPNYSTVFDYRTGDNMRVEMFDDDTCLIYYIATTDAATDDENDVEKKVIRFLTVDESGNWIRKEYYADTSKSWADLTETIDLSGLKLRLYSYTTRSGDKTVSYSGNTSYQVLQGTAEADLIAVINQNFHVIDSSVRNQEIACSGSTPMTGYYWLDMSTYDGTKDCKIAVKYRNDNGTDSVITNLTISVEEYFDMYIAYNDDDTVYDDSRYGSRYGFLYQGDNAIYEEVVNCTNLMDMTLVVRHYQNGVTTSTISVTPDMLIDSRTGKAVDISVVGEHAGLTLMYDGQVIGENFVLNVASSEEALRNPAYPNPGSVITKKQGTTTEKDFLNTGVANIQLSATGVPLNRGVDLIIVMDLSGSMRNALDTNFDAVAGQQSRIDAMQNALKELITSLQSDNQDVRIAMSDFGDLDHFAFEDAVSVKTFRNNPYYDANLDGDYTKATEFYNYLNWVLSDEDSSPGAFKMVGHKFNPAHSQYTGQVIPEVYTGSGAVNAGAFVDVNSLNESAMAGIIAKMNANVDKALGTNYDIGLEYAYRLGYAIRQENIKNGEDRELVCIFMSDGAAIQYNYFSGNALSSSWSDLLMGKPEDIDSLAEYYSNQANWPEEIEQISKTMLELLTTKFDDSGESANQKYYTAFSTLLAPDFRSRARTEYFTYVPSSTREGARYFYTFMDDQGYELDWDFLYRLAVANGFEEHIGQTFTQDYYHNTDNVLQYLIDRLTTPKEGTEIVYGTDENGNQIIESFTSNLVNPDYRDLGKDYVQKDLEKYQNVARYKYYHLPDFEIDHSKSYTDQLFAAMEALGEDFTWEDYARIAYVNRSSLPTVDVESDAGTVSTNIRQALVSSMKSPVAGYGDYQTLSPYDYFYNAEGKNWWAEAMKGETDQLYPVINKYAFSNNPAWGNDGYYGTVRNNFTTGTGLELDGQDYISGFQGLGMELYTVSFSICDDNLLTVDVAENVLKNVASGVKYFYAANTEDDLTNVLKVITSTMSGTASRAWYTDTMGPEFDLSTETSVLSHDGLWVTVNAAPSIRVMEYDMVQTVDAQGNVTYVRTESPRIIETVTFEDIDGDGDVDAWSNLIYNTREENGTIFHDKVDIWDEETGLISAVNFYYNANTDKSVRISFGASGNFALESETFFWIIGLLGQTEIVLEYQVYLTGSIEGERLLTSNDYYHATNTNAELHYVNYLGQDSTLGTVSPEYPWGDAKVGIGYYLVNENGELIANRITGETTTDFSKAIKLTRPVHEYMLWNEENNLASGSFGAADWRPEGHTLYSPQASYDVNLSLNGSGEWVISDSTSTTYVEVDGSYYNANKTFANGTFVTNDTVVWFAVVDKDPVTAPDTVVIDYGLSVDIDVVGNDFLLNLKGTLEALGAFNTDNKHSVAMNSGYSTDGYQGKYGHATIENGKVHYELNDSEINGYERFNYAVRYEPEANESDVYAGYYYNTVTIIPATVIYYEESFAQFATYKLDSSGRYVVSDTNKWTDVQDSNYDGLKDIHQDQDRPGEAMLPEIDADNIYGFDSAYSTSSQYSLGMAKKFTANSNDAGTVTFNFYGTGFDVISLTNNDTGTIMVDVYNADGYVADQSAPVHSYAVDTYYGYSYDMEKNEWILTENGEGLYQVPVMKVEDLPYGHYTAVITVAYAEFFDHKLSDASYDFYMDAIRVYNPAGDDVDSDSVIGDAYVQDGEYNPVFEELRNILLTERDFYDHTEESLGAEYIHGAVFIDGIPVLNGDHYDTSFKKDPPYIGTYMNYGPNNEVYLAPGQAIAFKLNGIEGLKAAHLALKSTEGTAKIKIFSTNVNIANAGQMDITTATDRYYDLTDLVGQTVVIVNVGDTGDGILSVTNVKLTTDAASMQTFSVPQVFTMSRRSAQMALLALTAEENPGEEIPPTGDNDFVFGFGILACLCVTGVVAMVATEYCSRKRKGE